MRNGLPIRWRFGLSIAALVLLIVFGFALTVERITSNRLMNDFQQGVARSADDLASRILPHFEPNSEGDVRLTSFPFNLKAFASGGGAIAHVASEDRIFQNTRAGVSLGAVRTGEHRVGDLWVVTRPLTTTGSQVSGENFYVQYARSLRPTQKTIARDRILLIAAALLSALLALVGSLLISRRVLRPVSLLTRTAHEIARTGDRRRRLPIPSQRDELSELATTLDAMLDSLDAARTTTERTLETQRAFLADASHELRTPLTSMTTNLELLADSNDAEVRDPADSALRSARRMRGLVTDLLALARADAAGTTRSDRFELGSVVREAQAELGPLLDSHLVETQIAEVMVLGSRDDLQRVARNLLENALRHTPSGTRIVVTVDQRGTQARLAVEDDGPGIAPEIRGRAFERFVRTGGRRSESSGLGLSIVRATAQAHGGWVELKSPVRGGHGTRVEIRLPVAD